MNDATAGSPGLVAGERAPAVAEAAPSTPRADALDVTPGKVTIVAFWSESCRWCEPMLDVSSKLARSLPEDVEVLAVNTDAHQAELSTNAKGVRTAWDGDGQAAAAYGAPEGEPSFFVVDRNGIVRHAQVGFRGAAENELVDRVADLATSSDLGTEVTRVASHGG